MSLVCSNLRQFLANFRHKFVLLSLTFSRFSSFDAWSQQTYSSPSISLHATFCTRSRSELSSSVSEQCQTWQLCSRIEQMYKMYMFSRSFTLILKVNSFCRIFILWYHFFTKNLVFLPHVRSEVRMVPRSFVSVIISNKVFSRQSLVVNWKFYV